MNAGMKRCPDCSGTGYIGDEVEADICWTCEGEGFVEWDDDDELA